MSKYTLKTGLHSTPALPAPELPSSPLSAIDSGFPLTPASRSDFPVVQLPMKHVQKQESSYEYPLENCSGLVEVVREDEDHIDLEEEERAYRAFDLDESDSSVLSLATRNNRPKLTVDSPRPSSRPRPPSSIFSHDIWVGENGEAEKDGSFARGVRIVGWTSVGDKIGGAYVVYDCAILTHALTTIHVHKRYSAFDALFNSLLRTLPKSVLRHVPPLPPHTAWARFRPGFLESRRKALQAWLSCVLLHPEIGSCAAVREWVMAG